MAELIWAPSALKAIDEIAKYISKDSHSAAKNLVQSFFEQSEVLTKHPHFGKPVPELQDKTYRELLVSNYRIIYQVFSEDEIYILTVHHHARLLSNNPAMKARLRRKKR